MSSALPRQSAVRPEWHIFDPVYGPIGRLAPPTIRKSREGFLLIWERGTTRYTLGWRWKTRHRPHFIRFPMTDIEIARRELPTHD